MMPAIAMASLHQHVDEELGVSEWLEITQQRIDAFADATDDRQWIHVDGARAALESPLNTTIAHGFLTLSLISMLLRSTVVVDGCRMALNYGLNRVRFVSPLPTGSRIRGRFVLRAVAAAADNSAQVTWAITIEREGDAKPCCVAEWIVRYYAS
jgi:acyl dehydratase